MHSNVRCHRLVLGDEFGSSRHFHSDNIGTERCSQDRAVSYSPSSTSTFRLLTVCWSGKRVCCCRLFHISYCNGDSDWRYCAGHRSRSFHFSKPLGVPIVNIKSLRLDQLLPTNYHPFGTGSLIDLDDFNNHTSTTRNIHSDHHGLPGRLFTQFRHVYPHDNRTIRLIGKLRAWSVLFGPKQRDTVQYQIRRKHHPC